MSGRFLLINLNNTNTTFAIASAERILKRKVVPTKRLGGIPFAQTGLGGALLASVVPAAARKLRRHISLRCIEVSADLDLGIGIRYPRPKQIGADRLANAVAVCTLYGAPAIVVDFGTAVTFDIVNARREYVGGVIAPGLAAVTEYLYQRTALLPRIRLAEPRSVIGKSTVEAMRVGAVIGYRGLVKEILSALRRQPGMKNSVVIATGGYARLLARKLPEIQHVNPLLTLEGLRIIYLNNS